MDKRETSTWRPVLLIVLLLVAAVALRGHLPGVEPAPPVQREPTTGNPASLVLVAVLLGLSLTILGVAIVAQLRNRPTGAAGQSGRLVWFRGDKGPSRWRPYLILFALLVGYLLIVIVLERLLGDLPDDPPPAEPTGPDPDGDTIQPPPATGGPLHLFVLAATVGVVMLTAAGMVLAARRQRRLEPPTPAPEDESDPSRPDTGSESLARAAEIGLVEIGDLSRDPREAIIACYAAMERELARVPEAAPREFDTASEVLARAVDLRALHTESASRLVDLFAEARFSRHVMDEDDRQAAVQALQLALDELRSLR